MQITRCEKCHHAKWKRRACPYCSPHNKARRLKREAQERSREEKMVIQECVGCGVEMKRERIKKSPRCYECKRIVKNNYNAEYYKKVTDRCSICNKRLPWGVRKRLYCNAVCRMKRKTR